MPLLRRWRLSRLDVGTAVAVGLEGLDTVRVALLLRRPEVVSLPVGAPRFLHVSMGLLSKCTQRALRARRDSPLLNYIRLERQWPHNTVQLVEQAARVAQRLALGVAAPQRRVRRLAIGAHRRAVLPSFGVGGWRRRA